MALTVVMGLLYGVLTFIVSILVHEAGHYIMARRYTDKVKIGFTKNSIYTEWDEDQLSSSQNVSIFVFGMMIGFIPLIIGAGYLGPMTFILCLPYFLGCASDLEELKLLCSA